MSCSGLDLKGKEKSIQYLLLYLRDLECLKDVPLINLMSLVKRIGMAFKNGLTELYVI